MGTAIGHGVFMGLVWFGCGLVVLDNQGYGREGGSSKNHAFRGPDILIEQFSN
jgi:hypothetical protein